MNLVIPMSPKPIWIIPARKDICMARLMYSWETLVLSEAMSIETLVSLKWDWTAFPRSRDVLWGKRRGKEKDYRNEVMNDENVL